jgi:K+-sensing histidine kinase KdpD
VSPLSSALGRAPSPHAPHVTQRVLCAVGDSRSSHDAVHEALAFGAGAREMRFISVATGASQLDERRARHALRQAQTTALGHGIAAETELIRDDGSDVAGALLAHVQGRELLIAGMDGNPLRTTGSTATALAHRTAGPLLVARGHRSAGRAPRRILVAVDDTPAAASLVRAAGAVAAACGGHVHLVHVRGSGYGSQTRQRLAQLSMELIATTGAEPTVDILNGMRVAQRVIEFATLSGAGLVVAGRGGGAQLGRVGERLLHWSPCSLLVVPLR